MSVVSSKCQLGHVETINFSTRVPVFYRYEGEIFLILRGRDFVSEKSFTLPVPFPSVYFYLLNIIITSREVLQKLSV